MCMGRDPQPVWLGSPWIFDAFAWIEGLCMVYEWEKHLIVESRDILCLRRLGKTVRETGYTKPSINKVRTTMDGCVGCRDKAEESIVKGCLFTHRIAGQPNLHLNNDHTVAQNPSLPCVIDYPYCFVLLFRGSMASFTISQ